MTRIAIVVREPAGSGAAHVSLKDLICPYLRLQKIDAVIKGTRRFRSLSSQSGDLSTAIELELSADNGIDAVAQRLHSHLKRAAKEAGHSVGLEILLEVEMPSAELTAL